MNRLRCLLITFACIELSCNPYGLPSDRVRVYPVAGKATSQGDPMVGARIGFHRLDPTGNTPVSPTAEVRADGTYALTTYLKGDGAPPGEYAVTIYWPGERDDSVSEEKIREEERRIAPDRLKRAYAIPSSTKLRARVDSGDNTINFELPKAPSI